jgi:hypothetical protein
MSRLSHEECERLASDPVFVIGLWTAFRSYVRTDGVRSLHTLVLYDDGSGHVYDIHNARVLSWVDIAEGATVLLHTAGGAS